MSCVYVRWLNYLLLWCHMLHKILNCLMATNLSSLAIPHINDSQPILKTVYKPNYWDYMLLELLSVLYLVQKNGKQKLGTRSRSTIMFLFICSDWHTSTKTTKQRTQNKSYYTTQNSVENWPMSFRFSTMKRLLFIDEMMWKRKQKPNECNWDFLNDSSKENLPLNELSLNQKWNATSCLYFLETLKKEGNSIITHLSWL
jgi:hypothetical protein